MLELWVYRNYANVLPTQSVRQSGFQIPHISLRHLRMPSYLQSSDMLLGTEWGGGFDLLLTLTLWCSGLPESTLQGPLWAPASPQVLPRRKEKDAEEGPQEWGS